MRSIVVLPSGFHRGRYTLGCYRKMGIDECIARDGGDFVERAVRIGTDEVYRRELETRILEASSVLFDDYGAVLEHERIFEELLQ